MGGLLSRIFGSLFRGKGARNDVAKITKGANMVNEAVPAPINDIMATSVNPEFAYDIQYVPGAPQLNAHRNRVENLAGYAQTQIDHDNALNAYLNNMGMPVSERIRRGEEREKALHEWVPGKDTRPRIPLTPSSSVASEIVINPENNIEVRFGTGKRYTYRGGSTPQEAATEAMKLINSGSIGRELNPHGNGWGPAHHM